MDITQTQSGIHDIGDHERTLCAEILGQLGEIDDVNKISNADLAFRFLIAQKWNVEAATKQMQAYLAFREESKVNGIFQEAFSPDIPKEWQCGFHGKDVFGNPVC